MTGPRQHTQKLALILAALLLLPACSARQPIPSDPPEVRTEASVRGKKHPGGPPPDKAPAPKPHQPEPVADTSHDTVIAEIKNPQDTDTQIKTAVAEANARNSNILYDAKPTEAKTAEVKAQAQSVQAPVEAKAKAAAAEAKPALTATAKQEPANTTAAAQGVAKNEAPAAEAKAIAKSAEAGAQPKPSAVEAPKPEPSASAQADAKHEAAKAQQAAPSDQRVPVVQVASFTTEKNADAALAWLKSKGYAEARVVRVEQGQTVFHRVQAGPFQDLAAARKALEELKADWPQAFIPAD